MFGEAGVVEGAVLFEFGDEGVDVGGAGGAEAEFGFEVGDGERAGGKQFEGVLFEGGGVEFAGFGESHGLSILCVEYTGSNKEQSMDEDKKFSYFFLGLGIGVAVGILFAPKSGAETRELLKEKADEGKEYLKRRSEELKETAVDALDKGRQAVTRQKEQLAAALEAGKSAYREKIETGIPPAVDDDAMIEGV